MPDKIYIPRTNMEVENHLEEFWVDHKTFDDDIEYIRKDAFIEKACEFLKDRVEHDSIDYPMATKHLVEDFKKYMKGEQL